jgi:hypothetical protein
MTFLQKNQHVLFWGAKSELASAGKTWRGQDMGRDPKRRKTRTEGVPKGRDFDNPRRQPGETWPQDQVAPTGRYVVQSHRHMRRFRQSRYRNRFSYTRSTNVFSHDAATGNAPLGLSRVGWAATPPADAGGYQNCVPSGRSRIFKCERARKKSEVTWLISIRFNPPLLRGGRLVVASFGIWRGFAVFFSYKKIFFGFPPG